MDEKLSAFGQGYSPYEGGRESRADELGIESTPQPDPQSVWVEETTLPLVNLRNAVVVEFTHFAGGVNTDAARIAANHLVNDMHALTEDLFLLNGRSAARSARALFEDAVTFATVVDDAVAADRYVAHDAIGTLAVLDHGLGVELLNAAEAKKLKRDNARRKNTAQARRKKVLKRYPDLGIRWHKGTFKDLCVTLGWTDRYEKGYRLLSTVTHGAAVGVIGTRKGSGAQATYRHGGAALEWVPVALYEGLETLRLIINHARDEWEHFDTSDLEDLLDEAFAAWPRVRELTREADRRFWPKHPPEGRKAILAIYRSGERWYIYERVLGMVAAAEPPSDEDLGVEQKAMLDELIDANRGAAGTSGRPVTIYVAGVIVHSVKNAKWGDARSILEPLDRPGAAEAWQGDEKGRGRPIELGGDD